MLTVEERQYIQDGKLVKETNDKLIGYRENIKTSFYKLVESLNKSEEASVHFKVIEDDLTELHKIRILETGTQLLISLCQSEICHTINYLMDLCLVILEFKHSEEAKRIGKMS